MSADEPWVESFVVRISGEHVAGQHNQRVWSGHITHVPDGARRYFQRLDVIPIFISAYLLQHSVRLAPEWWARGWLERWKRRVG
jgi:hypothetical protein